MEVQGKRGKDMYLPHLLGHEGSGQVMAVGPGVKKVKKDDWVILGWIKGCGLNSEGAKYKLGDHIINSGSVTTFSTYTIVSENRVVPMPEGLSKDIAVLFGCALPTGAGIILNQLKPRKNSTIALVGLGGIGLSGLLALNAFKCKKIVAIDISDEKLQLAERFGASHLINLTKSDPIEEINKITKGEGVDYSMDAGGSIESIQLAFDLVKKNGGECIFASHPENGKKISLDPFDLISGKNIRGSWGGSVFPDKDIPVLANLVIEKNLPLSEMITKKYKLSEINNALSDLENFKVSRPLIFFE